MARKITQLFVSNPKKIQLIVNKDTKPSNKKKAQLSPLKSDLLGSFPDILLYLVPHYIDSNIFNILVKYRTLKRKTNIPIK